MMQIHLILALLFNFFLIVVCGYAIICGGTPERIGAIINILATMASNYFRMHNAIHLAPSDAVILLIDVVVAAGFFWLATTTIRFWPIWAAGFATSNLFMSILGGLLHHVPLFAYHTQLGIYAYLALTALAFGTFRLPRNAAPHLRNGSRRSWLQHLKETS